MRGRDGIRALPPQTLGIVPDGARSAFNKAINILDSMGSQLSRVLRRRPFARLGIIFYVLMLHLWVVFVLYHFFHHADFDPAMVVPDGIPKV